MLLRVKAMDDGINKNTTKIKTASFFTYYIYYRVFEDRSFKVFITS